MHIFRTRILKDMGTQLSSAHSHVHIPSLRILTLDFGALLAGCFTASQIAASSATPQNNRRKENEERGRRDAISGCDQEKRTTGLRDGIELRYKHHNQCGGNYNSTRLYQQTNNLMRNS